MRKLLLLAGFCIGMLLNAHAQKYFPPAATDTTARPDSANTEDIKDNVLDNIPTVSLDDNDFNDAGNQNISSQLTAGRDPFYSAASFNWSPARYRLRGYDGDFSSVYINGIPMDNLDNGFTPFGLWGGLNDVFRNRDVNFGVRYNTFGFGDISSTTNIDVRASKQRQQTSAGYAFSNRNYDHRVTLTHSTGLSKRGWAFTASGSFRGASEGYVPGTYYNGFSWFGAVDKKLGQKQLLSLIAFGAPTENGRQAAATQEMMELAGTHYYNPSWGYQDGKNATRIFPKPISRYLSYHMNTGLPAKPTWFLQYHILLASVPCQVLTGTMLLIRDRIITATCPAITKPTITRAQAAQVRALLSSSEAARQINWDNLYAVNRDNTSSIDDANGMEGNTVIGHRSFYIQGERVTNVKRLLPTWY